MIIDEPPGLAEILAARDNRVRTQAQLRSLYPDATVVSATIVSPGRDKQTRASGIAARACHEAIIKAFEQKILYEREDYLPTGYEAYYVINLGEREVKSAMVDIEERHPLGRLFDIDVIDHEGIPICRTQIGASPRRCLLCENDARVCMRTSAHSYDELLGRINKMTEDYVRES